MILRPYKLFSYLLCLIFGVVCYFYTPALGTFIYAKWQFRNSREIWITPTPLSEGPLNPSSGPKLTYFGYEFESPSAEVKEEKIFDRVAVLSFADCAGLSIFKPDADTDLLAVVRKEAAKKGRNIQEVFGQEAARSNYALRSVTLNLTPRDLRLFSSRREISGNAVLLLIKGAESQRFKNGLYSFATPWMRGFQEGDLTRDCGVVIEAFDNRDRMLTILVGLRPGKTWFAQPDLDRIIFSLRPVASN
jgi:hypothetical protein